MKLGHRLLNRKFFLASILLLSAGIVAAAGLVPPDTNGSAQSATRKTKKSASASAGVPSEAPMPFRIGEKLNYRVAWAAFTSAASIELTVPERRDLLGWGTWHFRALAHTLSPVRSLYSLDDQFDSYTDTATLESRQYETYLNEMGKKQEQVLHFLPEGQSSRGNGPGIVVSPGTRDPLGALYALRGVDWDHATEFKVPVYDGHDVYELRARLEVPAETVAVAAGNFSVSRIGVRLFQRGKEVDGITFSASLAHDKARTPVLMQADLPFGNLRVELVSAVQ
jgi:hypothetical protein